MQWQILVHAKIKHMASDWLFAGWDFSCSKACFNFIHYHAIPDLSIKIALYFPNNTGSFNSANNKPGLR